MIVPKPTPEAGGLALFKLIAFSGPTIPKGKPFLRAFFPDARANSDPRVLRYVGRDIRKHLFNLGGRYGLADCGLIEAKRGLQHLRRRGRRGCLNAQGGLHLGGALGPVLPQVEQGGGQLGEAVGFPRRGCPGIRLAGVGVDRGRKAVLNPLLGGAVAAQLKDGIVAHGEPLKRHLGGGG